MSATSHEDSSFSDARRRGSFRADREAREAFGRKARELRREMGYSQEKFAARCGLDRSYYGGVERGERNVALDNIATIARGLGRPVRDLFPDEEQPGERR